MPASIMCALDGKQVRTDNLQRLDLYVKELKVENLSKKALFSMSSFC